MRPRRRSCAGRQNSRVHRVSSPSSSSVRARVREARERAATTELASFPNPWFEWEGIGRRLLSPYHSPQPQTLAHGVAAASLLAPSASPTSPPPIASPPPPQPAPGFSFCPSDSELVSFYLRPRISGQPLPDATKQFFHEADVYATDPASLVAGYLPGPARAQGESKNWYFFSLVKPKSAQDSRKCRIVGGGKGTWKQERGNDVDDAEGHAIGRLEKFTYTPNPKEDKKPPEWLMMEFSVDQQDDGGQPRPLLCLCKIYQSPRFLKSASKNSASARKRKAPDERHHLSPTSPSPPARKSKSPADESSAVKRQLLLPAPPPPPIPLLPVLFPSPPPPAPNLPAEDDVWAQILADPELNWNLEEPSTPWPCSMTAVAPTLLGSGHGSQCA